MLPLLLSLCQMLLRLFQQDPTGAELNAGCALMLLPWASAALTVACWGCMAQAVPIGDPLLSCLLVECVPRYLL